LSQQNRAPPRPIRPTPNSSSAQAAGADYIVTGNKRDFPDAPYGTVYIVSAAELLGRIVGDM
jgi:hypothetical protein